MYLYQLDNLNTDEEYINSEDITSDNLVIEELVEIQVNTEEENTIIPILWELNESSDKIEKSDKGYHIEREINQVKSIDKEEEDIDNEYNQSTFNI